MNKFVNKIYKMQFFDKYTYMYIHSYYTNSLEQQFHYINTTYIVALLFTRPQCINTYM